MKGQMAIGICVLFACLVSASALSVPVVAPSAAAIGAQFPRGFQWGVSTAAYQIEGAADLRQPVTWDAFANLSGKVFGNQNGA
jgi:hypothetical protein